MSPIVENHEGLDFDIGGNANKIGHGVSYDYNPEKFSQLPVGAVHSERVWAVERYARPEVFRNDIKIQHQLRHEALDASETGLSGSLVAKRPVQLG